MDGRGRVLDNAFVERLWRTVKYEDIYLEDYASVPELEVGLHVYFYNCERLHQSLGYHTPAEVHCARAFLGYSAGGRCPETWVLCCAWVLCAQAVSRSLGVHLFGRSMA